MFATLTKRGPLAFLSSAFGLSEEQSQSEERRVAPRHEAALTAEVVSGGHILRSQIRNISTSGLTLAFDSKPVLFKGAQVSVRAPGFEPISGSVRWVNDLECGMAFNVALAEDILDDVSILFDRGKRARPGRAKVLLPAVVRAPGFERRVTLENISSGGTLISSGLALPQTRGLMIEIDDMLPIGGYVRWHDTGRCGLMFNKLLPVAAAAEIAERCAIHPSWLREVEAAHAALADVRH